MTKPCSHQTVQISAQFFVCAVPTGVQPAPDTSILSLAVTLHAVSAIQVQRARITVQLSWPFLQSLSVRQQAIK